MQLILLLLEMMVEQSYYYERLTQFLMLFDIKLMRFHGLNIFKQGIEIIRSFHWKESGSVMFWGALKLYISIKTSGFSFNYFIWRVEEHIKKMHR